MRSYYALVTPCKGLLVSIALLTLQSAVLAQERPWAVSSCELLKNPGMYADTLVSVPGLILYGPRQFTSHGYDCPEEHGPLQLVFGGDPTDPKDQFRLPQARLEAGTVPLKRDKDYEGMLSLMKQADDSGQIKMLRATLRGRFFTGPGFGSKSGAISYPDARLVISEVELVTNRLEDPVDFTPVPHTLTKPRKGCATMEIGVPTREEGDRLQRLSREPSENLEYLSDPRQVAAHTIASQENAEAKDIATNLKAGPKGIALEDFTWTSADGTRTYAVTVSRPYWLLPSTYSGDTVIWVPKQITRIECVVAP